MTTAHAPVAPGQEGAISVIIPAYRAAGTIGRAVDSLLAQTVLPREIVIVDDGSPDDITPVLAPYGDRVRMLRKANGGAASARNHGIEHTTSELISFLDADDYWEPAKLERQLGVLREHPEVGLCATGFYAEPAGPASRFVRDHISPSYLDRLLRPTGAEAVRVAKRIWTSTVLLRRSVLGQQRFDQGLRTAEDIDMWIKMVLAAPVYIVSEPLVTQVLTVGSLSRSEVANDCRNMLQVIGRYRELLGPAGVWQEEIEVYRQWAAGHLGEGEMRSAVRPAWQRLIRQPWSPQAWWILFKSVLWSASPWGSRKRASGARVPAQVIETISR